MSIRVIKLKAFHCSFFYKVYFRIFLIKFNSNSNMETNHNVMSPK